MAILHVIETIPGDIRNFKYNGVTLPKVYGLNHLSLYSGHPNVVNVYSSPQDKLFSCLREQVSVDGMTYNTIENLSEALGPVIFDVDLNYEFLLITSDGSLYRDGNIFRGNISLFSQRFLWNTGDTTTKILAFEPTNIVSIYINGLRLYSDSQFTVTLPNWVEILEPLTDGDIITIQYEHFIN